MWGMHEVHVMVTEFQYSRMIHF